MYLPPLMVSDSRDLRLIDSVLLRDLSLWSYVRANSFHLSSSQLSGAAVLHLLFLRGWSQIVLSIIKRVAISVIDSIRRFFASYHLPHDSMYEIHRLIDLHVAVARHRTANDASSVAGVCFGVSVSLSEMFLRSTLPSQPASFTVVRETLTQIFHGRQNLDRWSFGHRNGPIVSRSSGEQVLTHLFAAPFNTRQGG